MSQRLLLLPVMLLLPAAAVAQSERVEKAPPAARSEVERADLDARKLFGEGVVQMRRGLFLDAVKSFEVCLKLDPEALPPRRMLANLLVTVGRPDEALAMARQVTERAPDDFEAWREYATQLKDLGRTKEALAALSKCVACDSAAKYPDQLFTLLNRLSSRAKHAGDFAIVEKAQRRVLDLLAKNRDRFHNSEFLGDDAFRRETAAANERLGEALIKLGQLDEAVKVFDDARSVFAGRDDTEAKVWGHRLHWQQAQLAAARRDYRAALGHLRAYLERVKPGSVEPFRVLADMAGKPGAEAAMSLLASAAARDKGNLPLQLMLAETYVRTGQNAPAEELYVSLATKHPKADVYRGLFQLYERTDSAGSALGKFDEQAAVLSEDAPNEDKLKAARDYVRAMTAALLKQPDLVLKMLPLASHQRFDQLQKQNNKYRSFERLAAIAVQAGKLDEMERLLGEARQGRGAHIFQGANDEVLIGVLTKRKKYAQIKELCRQRLQTGDDNKFMYYYYLEQALSGLGEFEEALQVNAQALELAFSDALKVDTRLHRVMTQQHLGRTADALAECEKLLAEYPQPKHTRMVRLRMATILTLSRRHSDGEKILRQLLEADPNDAQVNNALGYDLADRGVKLDEAERLIRRAVDLYRKGGKPPAGDDDDDEVAGEDSPLYLDSLAWVLFRKGKLPEAREWQEKAVAVPGGADEPTLWDHLGDICFRMNDADKARQAWRQARELYSREPIAKKDGRLDEVARKLTLSK